MPHVTSIGLDVHARSVAAAAFNPFTGEVVHRDFGTCGYLLLTALSGFGEKCSSRSTAANPIWRFSSAISLMLK